MLLINNVTVVDGQVSQNNFITFGKSIFGVSIKHPVDWKVEEYNRTIRENGIGYEIIAIMCPKSVIESTYCPEAKQLTLAVRHLPQNTTQKDLTNYLDTAGRFEFAGYKLEGINNTTMAGFPAVSSTYTYIGDYRNETEIIKVLEIIAFNGNRAYAISYFSPQLEYDDLLPIVQEMIESIRIFAMPPCNFVKDQYGGKCVLSPPSN